MSLFPPARAPKGQHRRKAPKTNRRKPCHFVPSGYADHNSVPICDVCGNLRTDPRHDWPETPPEAAEVDERRSR